MGRIASCAAWIVVAPLLAWAVQTPAAAPKTTAQRRLVHPADPRDVHPAVRPHVERLLAAEQPPADPATATCGGVFLRIVPRKYNVDAGGVTAGARLGGRPFVFLTVPEAAYGRTLAQTFCAIGYTPEQILKTSLSQDKDVRETLAVVFAYPDGVRTSDVRDGCLTEEWAGRVYPATWPNLLALTERVAADPARRKIVPPGTGRPFTPSELQFPSEQDVSFLLNFPHAGKQRVSQTPYHTLKGTGGEDWKYRDLIERVTGASDHFRGDGRTEIALAEPAEKRVGFPEYLGPNARLRDLPAMAVVSLGSLRFADE